MSDKEIYEHPVHRVVMASVLLFSPLTIAIGVFGNWWLALSCTAIFVGGVLLARRSEAKRAKPNLHMSIDCLRLTAIKRESGGRTSMTKDEELGHRVQRGMDPLVHMAMTSEEANQYEQERQAFWRFWNEQMEGRGRNV